MAVIREENDRITIEDSNDTRVSERLRDSLIATSSVIAPSAIAAASSAFSDFADAERRLAEFEARYGYPPNRRPRYRDWGELYSSVTMCVLTLPNRRPRYRDWGEPWGELPVEVESLTVDEAAFGGRIFHFNIRDGRRFSVRVVSDSGQEQIIGHIRYRLIRAIQGAERVTLPETSQWVGPESLLERQQRKEKANARARKLLLTCLSPKQKQEFVKTESFTVTGKSGRQYHIKKGEVYNVTMLDSKGEPAIDLCAGPVGVPVYDVMLAQKLYLENDEAEFCRVANHRRACSLASFDEYGFTLNL